MRYDTHVCRTSMELSCSGIQSARAHLIFTPRVHYASHSGPLTPWVELAAAVRCRLSREPHQPAALISATLLIHLLVTYAASPQCALQYRRSVLIWCSSHQARSHLASCFALAFTQAVTGQESAPVSVLGCYDVIGVGWYASRRHVVLTLRCLTLTVPPPSP